MIQFHDLEKQYAHIKKEILDKIEEVIASRVFIQGKYAALFEETFSRMQGAAACAGCSSGTAAISLALEALGVGDGDEVITTPFTFIATAEAVRHAQAIPVFADIDPETLNIDPARVEPSISTSSRALLPVHLYGNPADMDALSALASRFGLVMVEDCCQAHLATFNSRPVGTFGNAGAFSFYPGKNLGAFGDAGAVVSESPELINKIKMLLDHGRTEKYLHETVGYNHRMDGIQAGVLLVKMKYLEEWTKKREKLAGLYKELLGKNPAVRIPRVHEKARAVYHLFVVLVENRDQVAERLREKGIATSVHYPVPLHLQPAFSFLGYKKGDFPCSEQAAERVLSLPMYPELTEEEVRTVCAELNRIIK